MFNRQEVKSFVVALGRKWLFPDFNNKLTWWVAGAGVAVILATTPLTIILYGWLIEILRLNVGAGFSIAKLTEDKPDYGLGVCLIGAALVHNVIIRFLAYWVANREQARQELISEETLAVDKALFIRLSEEFPPSGRSVKFLKDHNFEFSFADENLREVELFVHHAKDTDREFLDPELEADRMVLFKACRSFLNYLAQQSGPVGNGNYYSCIPDNARGEWDNPPHVDEAIKKLNEDGTACFEAHTALIRNARRKLRC